MEQHELLPGQRPLKKAVRLAGISHRVSYPGDTTSPLGNFQDPCQHGALVMNHADLHATLQLWTRLAGIDPNLLADLRCQGIPVVIQLTVLIDSQAAPIGVDEHLPCLQRKGGRQQDDTAALTGMGHQQLSQQRHHVVVVGMHLIHQQHFAAQAYKAQRLVTSRQNSQ